MEAHDLDCDVLVVGLGPVGAVMAALLGQTGRNVIAIDPQRDVYPLPRAAHIDHEIMRLFQALDIIDDIAPHVRVAPNYEFRTADGRTLMRMEREGVMGASGWPVGFNFYQPGVERAVRKRLDALPVVKSMFGSKFVSIEAIDADALTTLIASEDVGERRIRSRLVIGCDGAWSPVREACGIGLDDYGFDEPWLVLDALVDDETLFPPMNLQLCDPQRPTTYVHMGPGRLRWEFMLKPGEDPDTMRTAASLDALLAPWRKAGTITVERTAVYRFHGLVAREWRQGRVLLAGDAAHQMPPFMGQGLCSGLRDAANLAWKIDAALSSADLSLLDSYQAERDAHVRYVIERAIEMGRVVCTLDPARAAIRDAEMLANPKIGAPVPFPAIRGLTLDGSNAAGTIFPQTVVEGEGRLDDILGDGAWLIHVGGAAAPALADLRIVDATHDLPPGTSKAVTAWLGVIGSDAVLVRPDRYVFGTGAATALAHNWQRALSLESLTA
ncbi:bifunctional 3-(3-hydroxy-phenyl)propionate/3-hydroxycinnamic acid hydroxylase [Sphingomonas sp. GB1N7]|uniref:bifunctional 3-(3-hydroxy-phenyl)propionate/3-hydroxycinnamic acid hydroxylase n=1 Tax=Parasphingomonas caseinilytica TaxID=3096158 RepID=UPI002FCBC6F8